MRKKIEENMGILTTDNNDKEYLDDLSEDELDR
jgi:hypothetical protein